MMMTTMVSTRRLMSFLLLFFFVMTMMTTSSSAVVRRSEDDNIEMAPTTTPAQAEEAAAERELEREQHNAEIAFQRQMTMAKSLDVHVDYLNAVQTNSDPDKTSKLRAQMEMTDAERIKQLKALSQESSQEMDREFKEDSLDDGTSTAATAALPPPPSADKEQQPQMAPAPSTPLVPPPAYPPSTPAPKTTAKPKAAMVLPVLPKAIMNHAAKQAVALTKAEKKDEKLKEEEQSEQDVKEQRYKVLKHRAQQRHKADKSLEPQMAPAPSTPLVPPPAYPPSTPAPKTTAKPKAAMVLPANNIPQLLLSKGPMPPSSPPPPPPAASPKAPAPPAQAPAPAPAPLVASNAPAPAPVPTPRDPKIGAAKKQQQQQKEQDPHMVPGPSTPLVPPPAYPPSTPAPSPKPKPQARVKSITPIRQQQPQQQPPRFMEVRATAAPTATKSATAAAADAPIITFGQNKAAEKKQAEYRKQLYDIILKHCNRSYKRGVERDARVRQYWQKQIAAKEAAFNADETRLHKQQLTVYESEAATRAKLSPELQKTMAARANIKKQTDDFNRKKKRQLFAKKMVAERLKLRARMDKRSKKTSDRYAQCKAHLSGVKGRLRRVRQLLVNVQKQRAMAAKSWQQEKETKSQQRQQWAAKKQAARKRQQDREDAERRRDMRRLHRQANRAAKKAARRLAKLNKVLASKRARKQAREAHHKKIVESVAQQSADRKLRSQATTAMKLLQNQVTRMVTAVKKSQQMDSKALAAQKQKWRATQAARVTKRNQREMNALIRHVKSVEDKKRTKAHIQRAKRAARELLVKRQVQAKMGKHQKKLRQELTKSIEHAARHLNKEQRAREAAKRLKQQQSVDRAYMVQLKRVAEGRVKTLMKYITSQSKLGTMRHSQMLASVARFHRAKEVEARQKKRVNDRIARRTHKLQQLAANAAAAAKAKLLDRQRHLQTAANTAKEKRDKDKVRRTLERARRAQAELAAAKAARELADKKKAVTTLERETKKKTRELLEASNRKMMQQKAALAAKKAAFDAKKALERRVKECAKLVPSTHVRQVIKHVPQTKVVKVPVYKNVVSKKVTPRKVCADKKVCSKVCPGYGVNAGCQTVCTIAKEQECVTKDEISYVTNKVIDKYTTHTVPDGTKPVTVDETYTTYAPKCTVPGATTTATTTTTS